MAVEVRFEPDVEKCPTTGKKGMCFSVGVGENNVVVHESQLPLVVRVLTLKDSSKTTSPNQLERRPSRKPESD